VCVAFVNADVILATLTYRDAQWWLVPSQGAPVCVADDAAIWAIVEALVRFQV
jgi:hypothetical protein